MACTKTFLNSFLGIKNSKILCLLFISSFSTQSFGFQQPVQKNKNIEIQVDKVFVKNQSRFKYFRTENKFISENLTSNENLIDDKNLISEDSYKKTDFEKIEKDTIKWFINNKNWKNNNKESLTDKLLNVDSSLVPKAGKTDYEIKNAIDDVIDESNQNIIESKSEIKTQKSVIESNIDKTPPIGEISVGDFLIPPRGYINLKGPELTLNLVDTEVLEILKFLAKSGNYGFLYLENQSNKSEEEEISIPKITASFNNQDFSRVFNSLLMASNLQAKFERGIIFVGKNVFNKSLEPKLSKTYRINQASAASVGDYLSTLGARISKVLVKSSALAGDELGESLRTSADLSENVINAYGSEGGPLSGLIGTVDLRLQTITLVGEQKLILTAEKYIKSLDGRHRQVALAVKIIDVSLTKSDLTNNRFEGGSGGTYFINNGGLIFSASNDSTLNTLPSNPAVASIRAAGQVGNNKFINWLERKITNDNAKIIASPTLILGENQESIISGAANVDDSLGSATIGRPFANEAFIKVGENVITSFETTTTDGVTTCSANNGTAGITFGAKLNKVDDNGFVTFSLSPAISSVTKTESVANCGTQSTLSVRKLDTGIIRVKDGSTLVLTGVLKDEDTINTIKTPLLGDVPILGRLFRNNTTLKRKSELIILVTPTVINDGDY